jgi:hypothetical protein
MKSKQRMKLTNKTGRDEGKNDADQSWHFSIDFD